MPHHIVIVEDEAKVVQQIFRLYIDGYGTRRIANTLNEQGYYNATGGEWLPSTIRGMLKNRKYCGDLVQGMSKTIDFLEKKREVVKDESQYYVCVSHHDAIIDKQTFEYVQQLQENRKSINDKNEVKVPFKYSNQNIFSNKIFCGYCNASYRRIKRKNDSIYYKCSTADKKKRVFCPESENIKEEALKDIIKQGVQEKFADLRKMGIKTIMITGDNPLTAAAIAAEAGVDDFLAEATPEGKLKMIRDFQTQGHLVAMTGDGTNDAPALAQADVAVAMNTGTQAAKEAGNMVDLDSSPTKLIDIVRIGKQLLMTRGSLTTFSIANDLAKYFAIIPALFIGLYPGLSALNIMNLHNAQSAIFSAIIYNALIIVALIPLALKGVKYREVPAGKLLSRNLLVYGLGGVIVPFIAIKIIDLIITSIGLV